MFWCNGVIKGCIRPFLYHRIGFVGMTQIGADIIIGDLNPAWKIGLDKDVFGNAFKNRVVDDQYLEKCQNALLMARRNRFRASSVQIL